MEPIDDPKLSALLKEWKLPGAPASLDARVLGTRPKWWRFLFAGSIRVPVPIGIAIAALVLFMAAALERQRGPAPPPSPVSLVDFRPVSDPHVRVIGHRL
jgi:hypothetical protein